MEDAQKHPHQTVQGEEGTLPDCQSEHKQRYSAKNRTMSLERSVPDTSPRWLFFSYRSRALLGACAYKRDAPNNEYNNNDIPGIGSTLQFEYSFFPLRRIENGRVSGRRLQRLIASTWDES